MKTANIFCEDLPNEASEKMCVYVVKILLREFRNVYIKFEFQTSIISMSSLDALR